MKYLWAFFFCFNLNAQTLKVVTSDFPPFQVMKHNKVSGITAEIVDHLLQNTGLSAEIRMYPWPRAYKMALKEPNVLIFSIVRTPEREGKFKWIGSLAPYSVYFWKLKARKDVVIHSTSDAIHYRAGAVQDDNKAEQLKRIGFVVGKNLELVTSDEFNLNKLFNKRIDVMTFDEHSFRYKVENAGFDFSKFEKIIKLEGSASELQLAASLETSDELVNKLKTELAAFKKTKEYREIKNRLR